MDAYPLTLTNPPADAHQPTPSPAVPQCAHCHGWHFGACPKPNPPTAPRAEPVFNLPPPSAVVEKRCPHCGQVVTCVTAGV